MMMSLRDKFAMVIMQSICAPREGDPEYEEWDFERLSGQAYRAADAMLKIRAE